MARRVQRRPADTERDSAVAQPSRRLIPRRDRRVRQRFAARRRTSTTLSRPGQSAVHRYGDQSEWRHSSSVHRDENPATSYALPAAEGSGDVSAAPRHVTNALDVQTHRTNAEEISAEASAENARADSRDVTVIAFHAMVTLLNGSLFANRYWIEGIAPNSPNCLFAVDHRTHRKVLLNFFPGAGWAFPNALRKHNACLKRQTPYIARLLDCVENFAGFPPCLVLESGSYTLADRMAYGSMSFMECRWLLYSVRSSHLCATLTSTLLLLQILLVLDDLHRHGTVCGNLDPSRLAYFDRDFTWTWKLTTLEGASYVEEPLPNFPTNAYAAPERMYSGSMISLEPSSDMWALGCTASEMLDRKCSFLPVTSYHICIAGCVRFDDASLTRRGRLAAETSHHERPGGMPGCDLCASNGMALHPDFISILRFIQRLLDCDPLKRMTAAEALRIPLFDCGVSATSIQNKEDVLSNTITPEGTVGGLSVECVTHDGSHVSAAANRVQAFQRPPVALGHPVDIQHNLPPRQAPHWMTATRFSTPFDSDIFSLGSSRHASGQRPSLVSGEMHLDGHPSVERRPAGHRTFYFVDAPSANRRLVNERSANGRRRRERIPQVLRSLIRRITPTAAWQRLFAQPPPSEHDHLSEE